MRFIELTHDQPGAPEHGAILAVNADLIITVAQRPNGQGAVVTVSQPNESVVPFLKVQETYDQIMEALEAHIIHPAAE